MIFFTLFLHPLTTVNGLHPTHPSSIIHLELGEGHRSSKTSLSLTILTKWDWGSPCSPAPVLPPQGLLLVEHVMNTSLSRHSIITLSCWRGLSASEHKDYVLQVWSPNAKWSQLKSQKKGGSENPMENRGRRKPRAKSWRWTRSLSARAGWPTVGCRVWSCTLPHLKNPPPLRETAGTGAPRHV